MEEEIELELYDNYKFLQNQKYSFLSSKTKKWIKGNNISKQDLDTCIDESNNRIKQLQESNSILSEVEKNKFLYSEGKRSRLNPTEQLSNFVFADSCIEQMSMTKDGFDKKYYINYFSATAVDFPIPLDTSKEYFDSIYLKGIKTPYGTVKLGENQYEKLEKRNRLDLIDAIKETLEKPCLHLTDEEDIYAKSFVKKSGRQRIISSIIIHKDGNNISISTHERKMRQLWRQIKNADNVEETMSANYGISHNKTLTSKESISQKNNLSINDTTSKKGMPNRKNENVKTQKQQQFDTDKNTVDTLVDLVQKSGIPCHMDKDEFFHVKKLIEESKGDADCMTLRQAVAGFALGVSLMAMPAQLHANSKDKKIITPSEISQAQSMAKMGREYMSEMGMNIVDENNIEQYLGIEKRVQDLMAQFPEKSYKEVRSAVANNIFGQFDSEAKKDASHAIRKIKSDGETYYVFFEDENKTTFITEGAMSRLQEIADSYTQSLSESPQFQINEGVTFGYVYKGEMYLNPDLMNTNTICHEYTHLWDEHIRITNPDLCKKGIELYKNTTLWKDSEKTIWEQVESDEFYKDKWETKSREPDANGISNYDQAIFSECHARAVGKFGAEVLRRIREENGVDIADAVIDWNKEASDYLAKEFGVEFANDDIARDFFAKPMQDLFSHKEILKELDAENLSAQFQTEKENINQKERTVMENNFDYMPDSEYFVNWENMTEEEKLESSKERKVQFDIFVKDMNEQGISSQQELDDYIQNHINDDVGDADPYMEPYGENNLKNLVRARQAFMKEHPEVFMEEKQAEISEPEKENTNQKEKENMEIDNIKEYTERLIENGAVVIDASKTASVQARVGVPGERVETVLKDGHSETENVVQMDENGNPDWIVKNPNGEEYVIPDKKFHEIYTADPEKEGVYLSNGEIRPVVQINEDITFTAPWGEEMNIRSGGFLVIKDMNGIYGIAEEEFKQTYKIVESEEKEKSGEVSSPSFGSETDALFAELQKTGELLESEQKALQKASYPKNKSAENWNIFRDTVGEKNDTIKTLMDIPESKLGEILPLIKAEINGEDHLLLQFSQNYDIESGKWYGANMVETEPNESIASHSSYNILNQTKNPVFDSPTAKQSR